MKRIYLDCCCYNRPFDDQRQDRIHIESEAVLAVIKEVEESGSVLLGSTVLRFEISRLTDEEKKEKVLDLYSVAKEEIVYNKIVRDRADELLKRTDIKAMDALHVASAEYGNADIMLTTDDKLIAACSRGSLKVPVMNPVLYLLGGAE
jgi:hypothetical protein